VRSAFQKIWLKQSLGKLRIEESFEDSLAREAFEMMPLTAAHVRGIAALP
jgi:PIN domain nuclease of toxin-antitoxin system